LNLPFKRGTIFGVEALDGSIGKVDEASSDVGSSHVVVDTGPWILGEKVMLTAGVINRVDDAEEKIYVSHTNEQIKDSPEFDPRDYRDDVTQGATRPA
jgi:hypothetical protein